ncbi:uncharacterized protein LOC135368933 [Ornithodoros turicata]|uniref:uncharacterized protein LOC135368933 n=1 Tax=Ornithodoros turicata TaxID=34597 RepID=UPI003139DA3E
MFFQLVCFFVGLSLHITFGNERPDKCYATKRDPSCTGDGYLRYAINNATGACQPTTVDRSEDNYHTRKECSVSCNDCQDAGKCGNSAKFLCTQTRGDDVQPPSTPTPQHVKGQAEIAMAWFYDICTGKCEYRHSCSASQNYSFKSFNECDTYCRGYTKDDLEPTPAYPAEPTGTSIVATTTTTPMTSTATVNATVVQPPMTPKCRQPELNITCKRRTYRAIFNATTGMCQPALVCTRAGQTFDTLRQCADVCGAEIRYRSYYDIHCNSSPAPWRCEKGQRRMHWWSFNYVEQKCEHRYACPSSSFDIFRRKSRCEVQCLGL